MLQESNNSSRSLRIAIGVGGRFHADRMAEALLGAGHELTLFSSFPRFKFKNIPTEVVQPILYPEIIFRGLRKLRLEKTASDLKMSCFGKELAKKTGRGRWDVFIGWSSFSKETFEKKVASRQILMRDSSHIVFQMDTLEKEYSKLGVPFVRDNQAEDRECVEYELADEIYVLSDFAKETFIEKGIPRSKLKVLRLGVDSTLFFPAAPKNPNLKRPLQVVYFGAVSIRKGIHYLLECSKRFSPDEVQFHIVGSVEHGLRKVLGNDSPVFWYPSMKQRNLSEFLRGMDVFVFPTLEDGFGQTLIQAMSSGLVPIFTRQSGASELVEESDGISIEARSDEAIEAALKELLRSPGQFENYRCKSIEKSKKLDWKTYEQQLLKLIS